MYLKALATACPIVLHPKQALRVGVLVFLCSWEFTNLIRPTLIRGQNRRPAQNVTACEIRWKGAPIGLGREAAQSF